MWPTEALNQLAPRAALLVEGTAFKKVARLDPSKLRVNDQSGVALLVDAIGGSWGSTDFEEKYEYFERALYGTVQRSDESHDSYVARMEVNFMELISRGTKLEEVQAYILLRQSLLPPEDKKKILIEHDGDLKYAPVVKSFRLLGSKFFNDLQGGRASNKTKVYDVHFTESFDSDGPRSSDDFSGERAFTMHVDDYEDLDPETFESFLASEDQDALIVSSFEQELEDFLQDVPEMHEAMVSYLEARGRLLEKRKSRGFWPVRSKGFNASKGSKGKGKGKRQRENLLARIAKSYCRKCGAKGHWKAECPSNRGGGSGPSDENPSASANVVQVHDVVEQDAFDVQEVHSESDHSENAEVSRNTSQNAFVCVEEVFVSQAFSKDISHKEFQSNMHRIFRFCKYRPQPMNQPPRFKVPQIRSPSEKCPTTGVSRGFCQPISEQSDVCHVAESTKVCAILDTGASRCVIGEKIWEQLMKQFPESLRKQIRRCESQVKFRFGNNQSLTSQCKMQIPLANQQTGRRLWLSIEVVPGSTPFLFSKRAFKQLGGILDTTTDSCTLQRLGKTLQLEPSKTELYLLDLMQLCLPTTRFTNSQCHASCHVGDSDLTGVSKDLRGKHDMSNTDEMVSLSMTDLASKLDTPCVAHRFRDSRDKNDAVQPHVDRSEDCLRGSGGNSHIAASGDCAISGGSACSTRERHGESTGDAADNGRLGARVAESESHVDQSATNNGRTESHERDSKFGGSADCPLWTACNNSRRLQSNIEIFESGRISSTTSFKRPDPNIRDGSSISWRSVNSDLGFCGRGRGVGFRSRRKTDRSGISTSTGPDRTTTTSTSEQSTISESIGSTIISSRSSSNPPRVGKDRDHLGSKAQGSIIHSSVQERSRILHVEPSEICFSATSPTGFREILSGSDGRGSSVEALNVPRFAKPMSRTFDSEVNDFRRTLNQTKSPEVFVNHVSQAVGQAEQILEEACVPPRPQMTNPKNTHQCVLLEVYANPNSPLTETLHSMGEYAIRFSRQDGDLATVQGRRKLWELIDEHQPLHIWAAPECGPWGGWNRLNMFKSIALFDKISKDREDQRIHVSLCAKICRYQLSRSRHFHLEQPLGSAMIKLEEFQSILVPQVSKVVVDMCAFGLRIPRTNKFLKKASVIYTTDPEMYQALQNKRCPKTHDHQLIEGSLLVQGKRMAVTQFCATYCVGFARQVCRSIIRSIHGEALVGDEEHEDSPPSKRVRFSVNPFKKFRSGRVLGPSHNFAKRVSLSRSQRSSEPYRIPERSEPANPSNSPVADPNPAERESEEPPSSEQWRDIFRVADSLAPRVGNRRFDVSENIVQQIQNLVPSLKIQHVFIGRGTERFQVPFGLPEPQSNDHRHTVCLHRMSGDIKEFDTEKWISLTRNQRIRKCMPCKLMISSFGPKSESPQGSVIAEPNPNMPSRDGPIIEDRSSHVPRSLQPPVICEGWAPPPVAIHGPKFRNLTSIEKQDLARVHNNLGHPDPNVLAEHLKSLKSPPHIVEAALEYVCDACAESVNRKTRRPAKLHDAKEFNDMVGMDGFFWTGSRGFQVHVVHCIDEASLFHLGRRIETRNPDQVISSWQDFWSSWAGNPSKIYTDPAGEFISQVWKDMLQSRNIEPIITTEAWHRGRVERHGHVIKTMLSRFDQDKAIENQFEFDQVLLACFQAKNALARHQGYSPEQIVLGKAAKLPASLTADDQVDSHALAEGSDLESEAFKRHLDIRTLARKSFLLADNDSAIRRALLHRSCPHRGTFEKGQLVMYWHKRPRASRHECGRWHGPARAISQTGSSSVWLEHADRLFKCAPESIRPASLREWNYHQGSWLPSISEIPRDENRPPLPNGSGEDYEPSIAPPSPVEPPPMITPQSSHQPESEAIPEAPIVDLDSQPSESLNPDNRDPLDLDPSPNEETSEGETGQSVVLHCDEVISDAQADLFEWTILEPGAETESILLAEDGLPMLESPLECDDCHCFSLEVVLTEQDIHHWANASKPEECAWVANVSKRGRSEVTLKQLTLEDRILFEKAKDAELNCWLQTNALKPILRRYLNPEQILRSRWVCTWKPIEDAAPGEPKRKAKARLVVLGFQDPKLTEVVRDSPTLTREGRHTVLQTIASQKWSLSSFDIKTAFLRGQADSKNPLAMEPPPELRKKLHLSDDQVCALVGNAYGRVDAPLLFYKELTSQLHKLGFTTHPLEPCVFILETQTKGKRTLHGILGTHVDDGICGGDSFFFKQIERLKQSLPFGSFKQRKFVFTGISLEQLPDHSIMASQEDYVRQIPAIDIGKTRRQSPESSINEVELSKLRGLIGSLQYAVSHTRPDMAAKLGEVQTQVAKANIQTLLLANKVLREAQENSQVKVCFRSIDPSELTHVSFGDASFASPKQLASFQGTLICATTPALDNNQRAPISPLTWSSKKIARVVRSTLSAEAYSMSNSVDRMGWMRLLWGVINVDQFDWRQPKVCFKQLPVATVVTDCKSLFDLVSRNAMPSCEEYRTTLEVLLIRERCSEHCHFRWIPTALQVADALTKPMDPVLLRQVLECGSFQLFDEDTSLEKNAHRKAALSWFREQAPGDSHIKRDF